MKKSPKYNEINVYHLEGKILRNILRIFPMTVLLQIQSFRT